MPHPIVHDWMAGVFLVKKQPENFREKPLRFGYLCPTNFAN
jgi:hypothetical protein